MPRFRRFRPVRKEFRRRHGYQERPRPQDQPNIAVGGRFGTLSEIAFALRQGNIVVGLGTCKVHPDIVAVNNPEHAVTTAIKALPDDCN